MHPQGAFRLLSHRYSGDHPILSEGPISRGLGHISRARPFCLPLGAAHWERVSPADVWSLRVLVHMTDMLAYMGNIY